MSVLDQLALGQSLNLIQRIQGVKVIGRWEQRPGNIWTLPLCLDLIDVEPSPFVLAKTHWNLVVDFGKDTFGKTLLYPTWDAETVSVTFPHQMFNGHQHKTLTTCRSGHLCTASGFDGLAANRNAIPSEPESTIERVLWHVHRALEWLQMAANNQLSVPGSAFELPDYTFGKFAAYGALAYFEDKDSLKVWQTADIEAGVVELVAFGKPNIILAKRFLDNRRRNVIYEPSLGNVISGKKGVFPGLWLTLPELPIVKKWQAPSTIAELQEAFSAHGRDLKRILEPLWSKLTDTRYAILLIGAPIPKKIGESPAHMHWQAIMMVPPQSNQDKRGWVPLVKHHMSMANFPVSWLGRAENWCPEEIQSRGRLQSNLCDANVLMLGAGALGSCMAEQLVRMGVKKMTIIDDARFEAGNLVRHSLTIDNINQLKAEGISQRLNKVNLSASISFVDSRVPEGLGNANVNNAITDADLVIDVTANDDILKAMPLSSLKAHTPVVSCSLSIEARQLYFYAHRSDSVNWGEFNEWYDQYRTKNDTLVQHMDLPRGLGCWHPLTPARINRIQSLSGMAVELIEQIFEDENLLPAKLVIDWSVPSLKKT